MIRLLFIPFLVLFLFSCDDSSKEFEELFYQMSEADSARCMDDILDGILEQAAEFQKFEDEMYSSGMQCFVSMRMYLEIRLYSRDSVHVNIGSDSSSVVENVFNYFMFNRNLTSAETAAASMDSDHPGFELLFYNQFENDEIQREIQQTTEEFNEVKKVEDVDSGLLEYYWSNIEQWKKLERTMQTIGSDTLTQVSPQARVSFEYPKVSSKSNEVLREIAFAFYQMRNYESLRYFKESYLNLYERAQRKKRKMDKEKLNALEVLHPAPIYCEDSSKPRYYLEFPPPEEAP